MELLKEGFKLSRVVKPREMRLSVGLPAAPLTREEVSHAPALNIQLELLKLSGYHLGEEFFHNVVTKSGIYIVECPEEIAERMEVFTPSNAFGLMHGQYMAEGWLPYSVQATSTTVRIDYYSVEEPDKRGVIELGRNFHQLMIKVDALNAPGRFSLQTEEAEISLPWWGHSSQQPDPLEDTIRFNLGDNSSTTQKPSEPSGQSGQWQLNLLRTMSYQRRLFGFGCREFLDGVLGVTYSLGNGPGQWLYHGYLTGKDYNRDHWILVEQ